MKTLNKNITTHFFKSENGFSEIKTAWKAYISSPENQKSRYFSTQLLIYAILRGKNWQKSFSLPTNKNKVDNSYHPAIENVMGRLRMAMYYGDRTNDKSIILAPFKDIVVDNVLSEIEKVLSKTSDLTKTEDGKFSYVVESYKDITA